MRKLLVLIALFVAACSSEPAESDPDPECTSDQACASGRCDLETFRCEAIPPRCGDGTVDEGETCDGNCTASCNDADACTTDLRRGESSACNVTCDYEPVTACESGDGCCPSGCTEDDDADCAEVDPNCGNGVIDGDESCDPAIPAGDPGACPFSCAAPPGTCFDRVLEGNRQACDVVCRDIPKTECVDSDGCCPSGCTSQDDSDCSDVFFVGTACETDQECASSDNPDAICLTDSESSWTDGYCSKRCFDQQDCPDGSVCSGTVCVRSCGPDEPCRDDYSCVADPFVQQSRPVCLPDGKALTGAPCSDVSDCLGGVDGVRCMAPTEGFKDGMCMPNCTIDDECGLGGECVEWEGAGRCLETCTSTTVDNDTCRDGYQCHPFFFESPAGGNVCTPSGEGSKEAGEPCVGLYECEGGLNARCLRPEDGFVDFEDGYCSKVNCQGNFSCEFGADCSYLVGTERLIPEGGGLCLDRCDDFDPCRPGYSCQASDTQTTSKQCVPDGSGTGQVGDTCNSIQDCAGGTRADCADQRDGFKDGYCRLECTTDNECPTDTSCAALGSERPFCIETCANDTECRDGFICLDHDRDGTRNCIPGGTGTGEVGEACEEIFDCSYGRLAICFWDWPDGYCSRYCNPTVTSIDPCPSGTFCGVLPGAPFAVCVPNCTSMADCRPGYRCGGVTVYDGTGSQMLENGCEPTP